LVSLAIYKLRRCLMLEPTLSYRYVRIIGYGYLRTVLRPSIVEILQQPEGSFEVDPHKVGKGGKRHV
jgi:hypothetical protein